MLCLDRCFDRPLRGQNSRDLYLLRIALERQILDTDPPATKPDQRPTLSCPGIILERETEVVQREKDFFGANACDTLDTEVQIVVKPYSGAIAGIFLAVLESELETIHACSIDMDFRCFREHPDLQFFQRCHRFEIGNLKGGFSVLDQNTGISVTIKEILQEQPPVNGEIIIVADHCTAQRADTVERPVARNTRKWFQIF